MILLTLKKYLENTQAYRICYAFLNPIESELLRVFIHLKQLNISPIERRREVGQSCARTCDVPPDYSAGKSARRIPIPTGIDKKV